MPSSTTGMGTPWGTVGDWRRKLFKAQLLDLELNGDKRRHIKTAQYLN